MQVPAACWIPTNKDHMKIQRPLWMDQSGTIHSKELPKDLGEGALLVWWWVQAISPIQLKIHMRKKILFFHPQICATEKKQLLLFLDRKIHFPPGITFF